MKKGIFVSGTDTGVGKTVVSALIVAAGNAQGHTTGYFKPVQTGSDESGDTGMVTGLTGIKSVRPVYKFKKPAAPSIAAQAEGASIDIGFIRRKWDELPTCRWVVEGAGGLLTPLSDTVTMRDLIRILNLPLVVVASTRLGMINHTLLTLEAAARDSLKIAGVILTGPQDKEAIRVLSDFTRVPVLAHIPVMEVNHSSVANYAKEYFPMRVLGEMFDPN
ncbi:MAG: dethiobiotin synthase [Bdellovibrionota bacterium]